MIDAPEPPRNPVAAWAIRVFDRYRTHRQRRAWHKFAEFGAVRLTQVSGRNSNLACWVDDGDKRVLFRFEEGAPMARMAVMLAHDRGLIGKPLRWRAEMNPKGPGIVQQMTPAQSN